MKLLLGAKLNSALPEAEQPSANAIKDVILYNGQSEAENQLNE
jgi:hypothetical protein